MSKIIKLTSEKIEECAQEFIANLRAGKFADGKISYNKTLGAVNRRATLYFTEKAWIKMRALVNEFDKEVAWHGVAVRGEDKSKDEYYITDILVYPQTVTGTTVEMDVEKYDEWIRENFEDERFFNIRMQGHSHVRMSVTPSGVDLSHQEAILDQLTDDMFYIFVIWNKSDEKNVKIYDLAKNVLFETSDVDVEVLNDGYDIKAFIEDAKEMVEEKRWGISYYGGGYGISRTSPITAAAMATAEKKEEPKTNTQIALTGGGKSGKRKGKRKKKNKNDEDAFHNTSQCSFDDYYDCYEDDYYPLPVR